jgi:hypothetical protein
MNRCPTPGDCDEDGCQGYCTDVASHSMPHETRDDHDIRWFREGLAARSASKGRSGIAEMRAAADAAHLEVDRVLAQADEVLTRR